MNVAPINPTSVKRYLRRSISLARELEDHVSLAVQRKEITLLGYGFVVRNRRLASAILRLGEQWAYEGRMLLRSMIEIYINYAWMRLKPQSRARRFTRFEPLERLQILQDMGSGFDEELLQAALSRFRKERTTTRHLFRYADRKRKRRWATSWAHPYSFEARLVEVQKHLGSRDRFLYGWYRWTSSTTHGGPTSLTAVLQRTLVGAREKPQPEPDPAAQFAGAIAALVATIVALAEDTDTAAKLEPELSRLAAAARSYRPAAEYGL